MEIGQKEWVRVQCPQCNDQRFSRENVCKKEPSYCEGLGYIEAPLWKDAVKK